MQRVHRAAAVAVEGAQRRGGREVVVDGGAGGARGDKDVAVGCGGGGGGFFAGEGVGCGGMGLVGVCRGGCFETH